MSTHKAGTNLFERLDRLNEFEREPVADEKLHGGAYFAGSFAGEHVAATEFVIGALFVSAGARTFDVIVGLLVGNLLAVLSWAWICAPIAVSTRLTLYWYLRKIGGPVVMVVYNVLNAILYCVLAGCMITVAASAVRIPFGIEPQTGWLPTDPWFVVVTVAVGSVVVLLAILGFKRLAQFSSVCSPWLFTMFLAGAIVLLPHLGPCGSLQGFWALGERSIWTGPPPYELVITPDDGAPPGQIILEFADGTLLRIAPVEETSDPSEGSSEGMFDQAGNPIQPLDTSVLNGFSICGTGPRERSFVAAQARIDGNRVIVSSPEVTAPSVVSYGESHYAGNLQTREAGSDAPASDVAPFRSYVAQAADTLTFWHIMAFAWICNLAMHLGLSDMALFRYARRPWYGVYSAFGMYLGHYLAWICAGVMGAAVASKLMMNTPLTALDSGEVAFRALGMVGALAVVIAGWTTSNPTLYRAGLALQVITPGWPRWLVTLAAGVITTTVACFPFVFLQLLGFVALYGLLLMPVGAIVVVEHWIFPRIGFARFWSSRKGQAINWPALAAWAVSLAAALACWHGKVVHLFFLAGPVWLLTALLYVAFAALGGAAGSLPEEPEKRGEPDEEPSPRPVAEPEPSRKREVSRSRIPVYFGGLAVMCLVSVLAFSCCIFLGYMRVETTMLEVGPYPIDFPGYLVLITAVYFLSAVIWFSGGKKATGG